MKNLNKIFVATIILTLVVPLFSFNLVFVSAESEVDVNAKAAILIDANSGKILYGLNVDESLPPASMTKMMTEYIVFENIIEGKIKWDDEVEASEYAHWLGQNGGSRVFIGLGEKLTVKELVDAMGIYSANDATVVLAEYIAGSETAFVGMMNQKAKEFGMENSHFATCTGYPIDELEEYAPDTTGINTMSARDAAIIGWHLITDYPESIEINSTPILFFRNDMRLPNWNFMLPGLIYEYEGVEGIKTGHTTQAGYCFTSSAERNNIKLISAIFGAEDEEARFSETEKLLDYGFNNYELLTLVKAKDAILGYETVQVEKGKEKEVNVVAKNNLSVLIKTGEKDLYIPVIEENESVIAPIMSEDALGRVTYEYLGTESYEYLRDDMKDLENIDLIALDDVEKASGIRIFFRNVASVFSNIFSSIYDGIKNIF